MATGETIRTPGSGDGGPHLIGIAASAGGLSAIRSVLGGLPEDLDAAVVVVQHLSPDHESLITRLLAPHTSLRIKEAEDGEALRPGTAYMTAPGYHIRCTPQHTLSLTATPRIHHVRPSADLFFGSMAETYGAAAIAVVLSGTGTDGSQGVCRVKECGGTVIVQTRESAEFSGMPDSAIRTGCVDHILSPEEIASILVRLVRREGHGAE